MNYNYGTLEENDVNVPVNVPVNVRLNSTEKKLLEAINENPNITYDELAKLIEKTRKTVMRNISTLKVKGLIERIGSDKSGLWKLL